LHPARNYPILQTAENLKQEGPMRQILENSQLFAGLDPESLADVEAATTVRHAARGEMLFHEGDPAVSFYVVGSGKVKVFKLSPDGKEQILMIANPGDTFAEAAIFNDSRYPAAAEAIEDSELLVVHKDRFVAQLGRNPNLAFSLIARLSQLLRKLTALIEGLALTDVTTRVAHYLLVEADASLLAEGISGKELTITLPEKKSVLASQLGTIPETLSRSLAKLMKEGVIEVDGPRITITDLSRLRELVE
jgi:CRP/FNR family transcriptional regulator